MLRLLLRYGLDFGEMGERMAVVKKRMPPSGRIAKVCFQDRYAYFLVPAVHRSAKKVETILPKKSRILPVHGGEKHDGTGLGGSADAGLH